MALDIDFNGTTADTVREVIGTTHDHMGFKGDTRIVARIVAALENSELAVMDEDFRPQDATEAASKIRQILWSAYTGGGASAAATCSLFHALGRENELGWITGEAHYGEFDRRQATEKVAERRMAMMG